MIAVRVVLLCVKGNIFGVNYKDAGWQVIEKSD